jgi:putative aldouronate transport system substrate-binding protein
MNTGKKLVTVLAATALLGSMVIACSQKKDAAGTEPSPASSAAAGNGAVTYPLKTNATLSYWAEVNSNLQATKATLGDAPFFKEWQKRTGVNLKFISPPANQAKETLNVLLASGDLPDMIEFNWLNDYPGGPEKAIKDGYILKLNDLIEKNAPALKKYLKDHPDVDKMVKTDNGSYYVFPFIRGDAYLQVFQGPIIRKDWLDELGLQVPTTIDEWYTVLKAFKEKKGATAPLSFLSTPRALEGIYNGAFIGAFGINRLFYLDNGKVKFGPAQPQYKDFLETFRKWYAEGLIDKNIATVDSKLLDSNMTSGASGATIGNAGAGIGKWMPFLTAKDPKANLIGAPYPVLNKGDTPKFGQKDPVFAPNGMVAITTKSKNPDLAAKMLDYGYTDEGHMLFNFGIEGVSYKMENGYPKYTDLIMKNPDKLAPAQAMAQYIRGNYNGPFVQDKRYIEQYLTLPQQKDAVTVWEKTDADKYALPPITPTPQESSEFAKIMNDVNTLVDETTLKIILGSEPLDYFDTFQKKLKSLNIDRAVQIEQAAFDRYNKR